ncbi:MAG: hypothetical protein LEGION0403_FIIPPAGN_01149 [Legionella sp.]|uniref:hypothetical protein n=1 Tax=Legionella sp. TaxID=459 RepID=UPI003D0A1CD1
MNKILAKAGMFTLLVSVSVYGWANACMPIAKACMQNGYHKGGEKEHKGLVKDCVMPVVMGSKTLPNTNFSQNELQDCKAKIAQKAKGRI